jgi:hypothetical protein
LFTAQFIVVRVEIAFVARGAASHILPGTQWAQGKCGFPTSWTKSTWCRFSARCFHRLLFFVVVFASDAKMIRSRIRKNKKETTKAKVSQHKKTQDFSNGNKLTTQRNI